PGLDRAQAQDDLVAEFGKTPDDDLRILVVNRSACGAHMARQRVAVGNAELDPLGAARAAILGSPSKRNRRGADARGGGRLRHRFSGRSAAKASSATVSV